MRIKKALLCRATPIRQLERSYRIGLLSICQHFFGKVYGNFLAMEATMAKNVKQPEERYLKVPFHVVNHPGLNDGERWLLAWLYSFGGKGCWQSNEQLAEVLFTSPVTITRRIAKLNRLNLLHMKAPKSAYRRIWVKSHPEVEAITTAWSKAQPHQKCVSNLIKNDEVPNQKCVSNLIKNVAQPHQKCSTTTKDYKSTIKETTAPPSPLPARGQAQAVLADRVAQTVKMVSDWGKSFGRPKAKKLPKEDFGQKRERELKKLREAG